MYIQEFDPNLIGLKPYTEVIQQPHQNITSIPLTEKGIKDDLYINEQYFLLIRKIVSVALVLIFAVVMAKIILMFRTNE